MRIPHRRRTVRCPVCGRLAEVEKGQRHCGRDACRLTIARQTAAAKHRANLGAVFAALSNQLNGGDCEHGTDDGTGGGSGDRRPPGRMD